MRGDLASAAQEAETAAAQVRTTTQALDHPRRDLDDKLEAVRDAPGVLQSLERQAAPLDASELTAQLAQADDVDTLTDAARLAGMASKRVADVNTKLLEAALGASADQLAVTALEATNLLPVRPAVREVLAALDGAGVHAAAGWAYLAKHVAADAVTDVIAALPEVCDGVVVYGDPKDAAAKVTHLDLDDPVVLASVAVLTHPLGADARTWVVAGPAAARYDTTAGAAELAHRHAHVGQHEQASATLRTERDAWAGLAAGLRALRASVDGHGGIAAVRSAVEIADAATSAARAALDEAESAHSTAEDRLKAVQTQRTVLEQEITRVGSRLERLRELASDLRDLPRDRARLTEIPRLLSATTDREQAATRQEEDATTLADSLRDEVVVPSLKMKRGLTRSRLDLDPVRAPVVRRIFELYLYSPLGLDEICQILNRELDHCPPPMPTDPARRATHWSRSSVRAILRGCPGVRRS